MIRSELRAIARYQQKQNYADSDTAQKVASANPAVVGVATGLDSNTGRTVITTLDGGTIQGVSIARSPIPTNSVIPAALSSSIGTILDSK